MNSGTSLQTGLERVELRALVVGAVALLLCGIGAYSRPDEFYQSYLFAFVFWMGISIGCTEVLMLHHLVGGDWGLAIRRLLESASRTLWVMLVLFVPILVGLRHLYLWARPDEVLHSPELQQKSFYLNVPFFLVRMAVYFIVWLVYGQLLNKWSTEQDRTGAPAIMRRLQSLSGPGIVIFGLTVTFAAIDLVMSLEPHWSSTIYGMMFIVGEVLSALSFVIVIAMILAEHKPFAAVTSPKSFHDLGNLLLTFVILWAYIAVAQLIIIWSGNLQDEIPWYLRRTAGGWGNVVLILAVFHFAVPFLLLLSRDVKRKARALGAVAFGVLIMQFIDTFWLIEPALRQKQFHVSWMDFAGAIGVGGLWIAFFAWQLKKRPLIPLRDPRVEKFLLQEERA
ncbi:MAG: hypothetical protein LAO31_18250 [Acidobacteriia bacterium]|nr:hypothetical protein [Terriglobia bacterium]